MKETEQLKNLFESIQRIEESATTVSFHDMQNMIYHFTILYVMDVDKATKNELWHMSQDSDEFWVTVFDDLYSDVQAGDSESVEYLFDIAIEDVANAMNHEYDINNWGNKAGSHKAKNEIMKKLIPNFVPESSI